MRAVVLSLALVAAAAIPAHAGRGTELTSLLPEDTNVVLVADVAHGRGSDLMNGALVIANKHQSYWNAETMRAVETYLVAGRAPLGFNTQAENVFTIVDGKVGPLLDAWKDGKPTIYSGVEIWARTRAAGGGEIAIVDKHLVLAPTGAMHGVIDRARKKAPSLATSKSAQGLRDALASNSSGTDIWGAILLDDISRKTTQVAWNADLDTVAFSFALATNIALDIRLGCPTPTDAATTLDAMKATVADPSARGGLSSLFGSAFLDSVTVVQEGLTVRIASTMNGGDTGHFVEMLNHWF